MQLGFWNRSFQACKMAGHEADNFVVTGVLNESFSKLTDQRLAYLNSSQRPSVARTKNRGAFPEGSDPLDGMKDILR